MLALEEERGDGAQRSTTGGHAAELIIVVMARPSGGSRLAWSIGAIALAAALAYVLYPVRIVVEGMGSVEPVFEDLVVVVPDRTGMVTRVRVSPRQDVDRGTPLFEFVPDGQWAVLAITSPGADAEPATAEPEWLRAINQRRLARAEALLRWSSRVLRPGERPLVWERRLADRLSLRVAREDDLALAEARAAENARLGRHEANLVRVFDRALGMFRGTEDGEPFSSDVAGMVYSLWVMQRSQFHDGVGEIMRPGTPMEVLGLVPAPPAAVREASGWTATVAVPGERPESFVIRTVDLGKIKLDARAANILFPDLVVARDSVFVRLALEGPPEREKLGKRVRITLTAPARSRYWLWLSGA
jgi:hypothetical protein